MTPRNPLIFISYSHRDEQARERLERHLTPLKREGVDTWFDGDMVAGDELDPTIRRALKRAQVFVALASPDYLHSTYCFEKEYGFALRKAARKKMHVIVAVIHACQWKHTKMAYYKLLPKDGKAVDQWARRGDAYENIVEGIRAVLKTVRLEMFQQASAPVRPARRSATKLQAEARLRALPQKANTKSSTKSGTAKATTATIAIQKRRVTDRRSPRPKKS